MHHQDCSEIQFNWFPTYGGEGLAVAAPRGVELNEDRLAAVKNRSEVLFSEVDDVAGSGAGVGQEGRKKEEREKAGHPSVAVSKYTTKALVLVSASLLRAWLTVIGLLCVDTPVSETPNMSLKTL
jgi:hypothetical protein